MGPGPGGGGGGGGGGGRGGGGVGGGGLSIWRPPHPQHNIVQRPILFQSPMTLHDGIIDICSDRCHLKNCEEKIFCLYLIRVPLNARPWASVVSMVTDHWTNHRDAPHVSETQDDL